MLVLKNQEGVTYNLTVKPEHTVGRCDSSLEIPNDISVSRQHASITVTVKRSKFHIELHDSRSKYGTYVNEGINTKNEVPKNSPITLNIGDRIRFGQQLSIWTLEEEPCVICIPSLTAQERTMMNKVVAKMNGILVTEWTKNCTHLTVASITMNTKVVCALAYVKPIVTVDYWKQLLSVLTNRKEALLPDYKNFIPPLADSLLRSSQFDFTLKNSRRFLFKDVKFIAFGNDQYNRVLPMVEAAGGTISDGMLFKVSEEHLLNGNVIVLQTKEIKFKKCTGSFLKILEKQHKRSISEVEICLSIADCSVERYCNPTYDVSVLFRHETQLAKDEATVLVGDTQYVSSEQSTGSNFSLNVNDQNRVFSESDDEDSTPAIHESHHEPGTGTRVGLKRKLEDAQTKQQMKNPKLDSFVIRKPLDENTSSGLEPGSVKVSLGTKKTTKDLFSFQSTFKASGKSSSSLFAGVGDRFKQNSSNSQNSSSIIADSLKKSSEDTNIEPRRSSRSLFTKLKSTSEKAESPALFSNVTEATCTRSASKRTLIQEEPQPGPSKIKKMNKSSKHLFRSEKETVCVDSEDEVDNTLNRETSKLTISKSPKRNMSLPVANVPSTVCLNQFVEAHVKHEVKMEPDEVSSEVKDILNKTVVLTLPLLRTRITEVPEQTNNSRVNFKKFKKSLCPKASQIIPITSLVLHHHKRENER